MCPPPTIQPMAIHSLMSSCATTLHVYSVRSAGGRIRGGSESIKAPGFLQSGARPGDCHTGRSVPHPLVPGYNMVHQRLCWWWWKQLRAHTASSSSLWRPLPSARGLRGRVSLFLSPPKQTHPAYVVVMRRSGPRLFAPNVQRPFLSYALRSVTNRYCVQSCFLRENLSFLLCMCSVVILSPSSCTHSLSLSFSPLSLSLSLSHRLRSAQTTEESTWPSTTTTTTTTRETHHQQQAEARRTTDGQKGVLEREGAGVGGLLTHTHCDG